jgi:hypothetical protein
MEQIDLEMVRGDDDGWTFDVSNATAAMNSLEVKGGRFVIVSKNGR